MSEALIPKEQLADCQRWEPRVLDGGVRRGRGPLALPTAAEIEAMHQRAHEEGYAQGMREGRARVQSEAARLSALAESVEREAHNCSDTAAKAVIGLAADIARRIIGKTLELRPESIVELVHDALAEYPAFTQNKRIALNPEDAAIVRVEIGPSLEQAGWTVFDDRAVARGGCRIETAQGELDATIQARWQRVMAALGQDATWQDAPRG